MYENSRFLKNRFTFCGVNTNFGQQWAPPAYYHLTPIVSKGKHCSGTCSSDLLYRYDVFEVSISCGNMGKSIVSDKNSDFVEYHDLSSS